jgi:hypothetical protein
MRRAFVNASLIITSHITQLHREKRHCTLWNTDRLICLFTDMLALLLVVVLFVASSPSLAQVPPTCCTGQSCTVTDEVKVSSICASGGICIAGQPVAPGKGNACFNTDIDPVTGNVVSAPIKDCCKVPADCTIFQPAAVGYTSSCKVATGETYGFCEHQAIVGFCLQDTDCPEKLCQQAACGGACPTALDFFFTEHLLTKKRSVFDARSSVHTLDTSDACATCVYTPDDAGTCCVDETQCPTCPTGQTATCSSGHKCGCSCTSCNNPECTTNADCASVATDPTLAFQASCKGPCFENQCVGGFCELMNNPTLDADGDGVPCSLDCNDNDPTVSTVVACIALTSGSPPVSNDADGDGFFKCGSLVTKFCFATCPAGFVALSTTQQVPTDITPVTTTGSNSSQFMLMNNCDVCDDNASKANPKRHDEVVCCEPRRTSDNAKVCNPGDIQVCLDVLPTPAPATDGRCAAWAAAVQASDVTPDPTNGVNPTFFQTTTGTCDVTAGATVQNGLGNRKRDVGGTGSNGMCTCTACPNEATQCQNSLVCYIDCDNDKFSSCAFGDDMTACCARLQAAATMYNTGTQFFVNPAVLKCCTDWTTITANNNTAKALDPTVTTPSCMDGTGANSAPTSPVLQQRCSCPAEYVLSGDSLSTSPSMVDQCECDPTDNDPTPGQTFIYNCTVDQDSDGVGDCDQVKTICSDISTATAACAAKGMVVSNPAMCDCNDNLAGAQFTIACVPDRDADGFPDCTACKDTCAATCPAGFLPRQQPPSPPSSNTRRRSALDAIQNIAGSLAKRATTVPVAGPTCMSFGPPTPGYCDCADFDFFAHPGSVFCSTSPIVGAITTTNPTPDHDYDCNGHNNPVTFCLVNGVERPFVQNGTRVIRTCFDSTDALLPETFAEGTLGTSDTANIVAGECIKGTTTCTPDNGFCPDEKKKRSITTAAPQECTSATPTPDIDTAFNPTPGQCYDYLDDCATSKSTPIKCSCECHICVLVDH